MASYKGKYPGPDKLKGNKAKLKVYRAALRSGSSKKKALSKATSYKAPAAAAPPTSSPAAPPQSPTAPAGSPVGSNSSGTITLQSNLDIENQALDNEEAVRLAEDQAAQMKARALLEHTNAMQQAEQAYRYQRGRTNSVMAYRGMRGDVAADKSAEDKSDYSSLTAQIENQKLATDTEADSIATTARDFWRRRKGQLDLARQNYTNSQSATNPTQGSSPEDAGLSATKPPARPTAKPAAKSAAKKTYKGKYPGPDKFKGNKKKIAAWKAAKRKTSKK